MHPGLESGDIVFGYGQPYPYGPHGPGASHVGQRSLLERAQEYDRALQQSMSAAAARKRQSAVVPQPQSPKSPTRASDQHPLTPIATSDRAADGGVGSNLGDSYVDDVRTRGGQLEDRVKPEGSMYPEQEQAEIDELADGGMVGLLAQIYGKQRLL